MYLPKVTELMLGSSFDDHSTETLNRYTAFN